VKSFRLWLVLLIAVLLPLRGALAAAMPCSGAGSGAHGAVQSAKHGHGQHARAAGHAHQADSHSDGAAHDHDHGGSADKCKLCAASCCATALVSGPLTVAAPQPVATVFPHLHAPPPSFLSDGEERPPRGI